MSLPRFRVVRLMALATAALFLPTAAVHASPAYHTPVVTNHPPPQRPRETRYYLPTGAPIDRSYTWYAPPQGYEVILEGTPAQPREVTVVGPDGRSRTVQLEGPVIMRVQRYVVHQGNR